MSKILLSKPKYQKPAAFFLALSLFFAISGLSGQEAKSENKPALFKETLHRAPEVVKDALVSPLHWKKKDFLTLSIVLGSGLILGLVEDDIQEWIQKRRDNDSDDFFGAVSKAGDGTYLCGFMAGLYITGSIIGNDRVRSTALMCLESFVVSSLFDSALKVVVGRARPGKNEGSHSFHPFTTQASSMSFPSGHSAAVWSVATVIADQTNNAFIDVACYTLASVTAISRMHQNKHWASDVLVGSALGYFTAKKICRLNRNPKSPKLSASFDVSGKHRGLTLSLSF